MSIDTTTSNSMAGELKRESQAARYGAETMGTDTMNTSETMLPGAGAVSGARDPLVDRAAAGAHQAVDRVAAKVGPAVGRVRAAAQGSAETMQAKLSDLDSVREEWTESARTYVRERPMTALGVAVIAGFLLSRWMRES